MEISEMGGISEINNYNADFTTEDGFLGQNMVLQDSKTHPVNSTTLPLRRWRGTRKIYHSVVTPNSGNVPKSLYHDNNIRNPKILLHHGSFYVCR